MLNERRPALFGWVSLCAPFHLTLTPRHLSSFWLPRLRLAKSSGIPSRRITLDSEESVSGWGNPYSEGKERLLETM